MTMIAVLYYRVRGRMADHRDYGHALIPYIAHHLRHRSPR